MVKRCGIRACDNAWGVPVNTIHGLPNPIKNPDQRRLWIKVIEDANRMTNQVIDGNIDTFGVCSLHFDANSFKSGKNKKLIAAAIPMTFRREDVQQPINEIQVENRGNGANPLVIPNVRVRNRVEERIEGLKHELKVKDKVIQNQRQQIKDLQQKIRRQTKRHEKELTSSVTEGIKKVFTGIFTVCQLDFILTNKKWKMWDPETMAKAIALHSISTRAVEFVHNILKIPFPSVCTINRYLRKIAVAPGKIINPVIRIIREEFENATEMYRAGILSVDEMDVDPTFCLDQTEDRIFGGEKKLMVVTVRGLFYKWKQIIYYDFRTKLNRAFVTKLIEDLHANGINVVGLVSDMGPSNVSLWNDLGVCQVTKVKCQGQNKTVIGETAFKHPVTQKNIFIFPDFPHLIKLLRNHLLDDGITVRKNSSTFTLDKSFMENLLKSQPREFLLTHKLTNRHLYLKGRQRQNVRTAFQLFSHTTSQAIRHSLSNRENESDFISLINNFADLCNVRTKEVDAQNPFKSPFGTNLEAQINLLNEVERTFESLTCGKKNVGSYLPFQKGILIYIKSLKGLYEDVAQDPLNAKYIMTTHLNQDLLENTFSCIRGMSGFKMYPTAVECKNRIKKILFGRNFMTLQSSPVANEGGALLSSTWDLKKLLGILTENQVENAEEEGEDQEILVTETPEFLVRLPLINPDISTENSDSVFQTPEDKCESGGLQYVASYIAFKLKSDHPDLIENEEITSSWIHKVSRGQLVQPSLIWLHTFRKFDEYFNALHGTSIDSHHGAIQSLVNLLHQKYPEIPIDIIKMYVKTRTNIRIKFLNRKFENDKFRKQELFKLNKTQKSQIHPQEAERGIFDPTQRELDELQMVENEGLVEFGLEEGLEVGEEVEIEAEVQVEPEVDGNGNYLDVGLELEVGTDMDMGNQLQIVNEEELQQELEVHQDVEFSEGGEISHEEEVIHEAQVENWVDNIIPQEIENDADLEALCFIIYD